MLKNNLPPGTSSEMIPGNRPEDEEWDEMYQRLCGIGLEPSEILRRVLSPYWNRGKK